MEKIEYLEEHLDTYIIDIEAPQTQIRFHQEPIQLQFLDASGRALFAMSLDQWQKLPLEKQEQMCKELQSVVDRYAEK